MWKKQKRTPFSIMKVNHQDQESSPPSVGKARCEFQKKLMHFFQETVTASAFSCFSAFFSSGSSSPTPTSTVDDSSAGSTQGESPIRHPGDPRRFGTLPTSAFVPYANHVHFRRNWPVAAKLEPASSGSVEWQDDEARMKEEAEERKIKAEKQEEAPTDILSNDPGSVPFDHNKENIPPSVKGVIEGDKDPSEHKKDTDSEQDSKDASLKDVAQQSLRVTRPPPTLSHQLKLETQPNDTAIESLKQAPEEKTTSSTSSGVNKRDRTTYEPLLYAPPDDTPLEDDVMRIPPAKRQTVMSTGLEPFGYYGPTSSLNRLQFAEMQHRCSSCGQVGRECFDDFIGKYCILAGVNLINTEQYIPTRARLAAVYRQAFQGAVHFIAFLCTGYYDVVEISQIPIPGCMLRGSYAYLMSVYERAIFLENNRNEVKSNVVSGLVLLGRREFMLDDDSDDE